MSGRYTVRGWTPGTPGPVDGRCPACGKWVMLALMSEPPQWACIDIDCVHGHGHPLRPAPRP